MVARTSSAVLCLAFSLCITVTARADQTVDAGHTLALDATGGNCPIVGTLTVSAGGRVDVTGDGTGLGFNPGASVTTLSIRGGTVASEGTMHIWQMPGGVTMTGGRLASNGGRSDPNGKPLEWGNTEVNVCAGPDTATIAGRVNLRKDASSLVILNVADGPADPDGLISAAITQSAGDCGLVKRGAGTLRLAGPVQLTGVLTVEAGVLDVSSATLDPHVSVNLVSTSVAVPSTCTVRALYFDGEKQDAGRWGAPGSVAAGRADHESSRFAGNGVVTVADTGISNRERWKRMKYGFFVHYVWDGGHTSTSVRADGTKPGSIDEVADGFDAEGFARDLSAMGVEYVLFTAWQANNFPLYPSAVADRAAGGRRSPRRDMVGDMVDACRAKGIRVLFYTHPEQAINWNGNWIADHADAYAELVDRYGSRIDGIYMDENSPQGMMNMAGRRFQNLERIIRRRNPDLVLMQNGYGNLYANDLPVGEWNARPGTDPMTWGYASRKPIAHTIASHWMAARPSTERTMCYTGEGIFRFTVMMAGACTEGGGMAWAAGPYVGGGWEGGVLEEMAKAGRHVTPVAESIKGTYPSRSYPTPGDTGIGDLAWGVATRSADDATEYLHVLKPPTSKTLTLPPPADGKVFANGRLLPSQRPIELVQTQDGLQITLSAADAWDPLDTVIAMDVLCPGGRSLINDTDPAVVYTGASWQHLAGRNRGEYGNDVHAATADGDSYTITFEGTDVSVISSRGADRGLVDFRLDDALYKTVDMAASVTARTLVFAANGLHNGRHVLKAVKRGGAILTIDAFQVTELLNDDDPRIVYAKLTTFNDTATDATNPVGFITYSPDQWQWQRRDYDEYSLDVTWSQTIGAWFAIEFNGTGVIMKGNGLGMIEFSLDGAFVKKTDMNAGGNRTHVVGIDLNGLTPGKHTLKGVMLGGPYVQVDSFSIYHSGDMRWRPLADRDLACVGNDVHVTDALEEMILLDVEGTDLDLLAPPSDKLGTALYYIDDRPVKLGTHYGGVPSRSRVLFSCWDYVRLAPGKRKFKMLLNRGEQMSIDAVRIYKGASRME